MIKQLIQLQILEDLRTYCLKRGYGVFPKVIDDFETIIFDADNISEFREIKEKT